MLDEIRKEKLENQLAKIIVLGMGTLVGLGLGGIINYRVNSYHIKKQNIPRENVSFWEMIKPYHKGKEFKKESISPERFNNPDANGNYLINPNEFHDNYYKKRS